MCQVNRLPLLFQPEKLCSLDCFLAFCLKKRFCQNNNKNKFEKHDPSGWKGLNRKIWDTNGIIRVFIDESGKVRNLGVQ